MSVIDKLRETFRPITSRRITPEEYLKKLARKGLNADGTVVSDPVPIAPPIGYKKVPSMVEVVRDMVRSERLAAEAREAGAETFEESEDFDIDDDDPALASQWANDFDPPLDLLIAAGREALEKKAADEAAASAAKEGGAGGIPPAPGGPKPPEAP